MRAAFFQEAIRSNDGKPLELAAIQELISEYESPTTWVEASTWHSPRFVHQNDEEFGILKKERRAGRPPSTREDLLRMKIAEDEKEYENGFCEYSYI